MKGFVPTPPGVVDDMVRRLFARTPPTSESRVLDPGCGTGAFIEGILRWCGTTLNPLPSIVGIESEPGRAETCRGRFKGHSNISIVNRDFLADAVAEQFDFVIGNPPYVPITGLSEHEKSEYRRNFATAVERFDLYLLFFEQALKHLALGGRLVFITPEKFLYVSTAAPLRRLLARLDLRELRLIDEAVFPELVTYPTITILQNRPPRSPTKVMLRDGRTIKVSLPRDGTSWLPAILNRPPVSGAVCLEYISDRISCGVATGADSVFVRDSKSVGPSLRPFAFPTLAGRELNESVTEPVSHFSMLIPYDENGALLPLERLGSFRQYLETPEVASRLRQRSCIAYKPWYSFHETPPLLDLLRPKLVCKDITAHPRFWIDENGRIVPRHSVYYIVPKNPEVLPLLAAYLNSEPAREWLRANCQRAANGFLRLQSHILKKLPLPPNFVKWRTSGPRKTNGAPQQRELQLGEGR